MTTLTVERISVLLDGEMDEAKGGGDAGLADPALRRLGMSACAGDAAALERSRRVRRGTVLSAWRRNLPSDGLRRVRHRPRGYAVTGCRCRVAAAAAAVAFIALPERAPETVSVAKTHARAIEVAVKNRATIVRRGIILVQSTAESRMIGISVVRARPVYRVR